MKKKRILVVVNSLARAGGEKYAFELIDKLSSEKFDFEVLTSFDLLDSNPNFNNYYLQPLQDKKIKIHSFLKQRNFEIKFKNKFSKRILDSFLFRTGTLPYFENKYQAKKKKFFRQFDGVLLIGTIMFEWVKIWVDPSVYLETHLISHQAQEKNNLYKNYMDEKEYNFSYMDEIQLLEAKKNNISVKNEFHFPLSIDYDLMHYRPNHVNQKSAIATIGVFTRINKDKPLNTLLIAFHELVKQNDNVQLNIYGVVLDGNYLRELIDIIKQLNLIDKIQFKGHSDNMNRTIEMENIQIIWNLSAYEVIGFATLEIVSSGAAIICNNIYNDNFFNKKANNPESIPPYFYDPKLLANFTNELILNDNLNQLAQDEFIFFSENYNVNKNMKLYEKHLLEVLN